MGGPESPDPQCTAAACRGDGILASLHASGRDPTAFSSRARISLIEHLKY